MSTSATSLFAGNSRYAADFQSIIDRAVAIASLPLSQARADQDRLAEDATALDALDARFADLEATLEGIESALGSGAYGAELSGAAVVSATLGPGILEGTYSIEVVSLGAAATAISSDTGLPKVTDPASGSISAAGEFTLTAGSATYTIYPASKTLSSLAAAINAAGAGVRATVVNVASPAEPDYRLSLESNRLGALEIQLHDGTADLLTGQEPGSLASYIVNGVEQAAASDSRTVAIAPGLTVRLEAVSEPGQAASITVTRQSSALATALESFAAAYNSALEEVDKHRGEAGGVLAGRRVVYELGEALRSMGGYSSSAGGVSSLTALGFGFEQDGTLTFQPLAFLAADLTGSQEVATLLGSTLGGGFLKSAADTLDAVRGPLAGTLAAEIALSARETAAVETRIADEQERINRLQQSLLEQMAAADALIATLEQQYSYVSGMLTAMRSAAEGYQ